MLQRVFKTIAALGIGQIIHILYQFVVPPVFISVYGVEGFALWILLTATTSHLNTLDFGLQTYLVNELTLLYHRGELERFHQIHSVGVRLGLMLVAAGCGLTALVACLPVARWLGTADTSEARLTLAFLSLYVLGSILLGQYMGLYRVLGRPQDGVQWHNLLRVLSLVSTVGLALAHAPFWVIAAVQVFCLIGVLLAVLANLRRHSPEVFPSLAYWSTPDARRILSQSAFFGLFSLNQLLVFQIPVLLLNRFVSPSAVVAFSLGRTLFSFVRQISNLLMAAVAPEITRLIGSRDIAKLGRTYRSVEGIVCATALVGCLGVFLASPLLLRFWLGKPELFDATLFLLLMLSSLAMLVKESKLYFQHATNTHIETAVMSAVAYALMLLAAVPAVRYWGAGGFISAWLVSEVIQILFLDRYNSRLLGAGREDWNVSALWRLLGVVVIASGSLWAWGRFLREGAHFLQIIKAGIALLIAVSLSVPLFGLAPLARDLVLRMRRRPVDHPLGSITHTL